MGESVKESVGVQPSTSNNQGSTCSSSELRCPEASVTTMVEVEGKEKSESPTLQGSGPTAKFTFAITEKIPAYKTDLSKIHCRILVMIRELVMTCFLFFSVCFMLENS